jgi:phosphatidylserine synthase
MQFGKYQQILSFQIHLIYFPRTLIILSLLTLLVCIVYKLKLQPDAYFNIVNFGILFFGYLIFSLQFISFCIMNAQLFDKNVRAILGSLFIYLLSLIIYPYIILWPTAIQYILIFLSPYIAGHSLFQVRNFCVFWDLENDFLFYSKLRYMI